MPQPLDVSGNLDRMTQVIQSGTAASNRTPITRKRVDLSYGAGGGYAKIARSTGAAGSEVKVATSNYSYYRNGGIKSIENTHSGGTVPTTGDVFSPPGSPVGLSKYSWTYDAGNPVASLTSSREPE